MTPFTLSVPDADLFDLRARLKATRFPAALEGVRWDDGMDLDVLRQLVTHWAEAYDWRAAERRLNAFPQFTEEVDGERVHFILAPGQGGQRVPLVLANGWPGNFVELLPLVPLLTAEQDGVSFDVILPSLQGFGFSGQPKKRGMHLTRMAHLWAQLLTRLGYERFLFACSDLGTGIGLGLLRHHPQRLLGAHFVNVFSGYPRPPTPTPEETEYFRRVDGKNFVDGAYVQLHGTKPQSLAVGLNDSPAGLAAWVMEKVHGFSQLENGRLESAYSLDDLCTLLSVTWFSQTIGSSVRLYKEAFADLELFAPLPKHAVKQGVLVPADVDVPAPRAWGERHLQNLVHWTEARRAGHFPGLEAPGHYAADLRAFHRVIT